MKLKKFLSIFVLATLLIGGVFAVAANVGFGSGIAVAAAETKIIKSQIYGKKIVFSDLDFKQGLAITDFDKIEMLLQNLDLYLMDIKHINSDKHKEFTTQPNEKILENARRIAESGTRLIIRVPVIPGFNDTVEEIRDIANFAKTLKGVTELHLLPYHRLGEPKYEGLGREYLMKDAQHIPDSKIPSFKRTGEETGLECFIGG